MYVIIMDVHHFVGNCLILSIPDFSTLKLYKDKTIHWCRAQRKEMLKQEIAMPYAPKTYAEALKTNLKRTEQQSVEDIFQSFTYYLKHLAKKDYTPNDWADIFFNFR